MDLALHDERDHSGEQRHAFHQRRGDDHRRLDTCAVLGLARHAFDGLTADPPDADAGAEHREPRREAVDLSIAAASKLLEAQLDTETNRRLVSEYLATLEQQR